jgi:hypothetical protein
MSFVLLILIVLIAYTIYHEFSFKPIKNILSYKSNNDLKKKNKKKPKETFPKIDYDDYEFSSEKTNYHWQPIIDHISALDFGNNDNLFIINDDDELSEPDPKKFKKIINDYSKYLEELINNKIKGRGHKTFVKTDWERQREQLGLVGNLYHDYEGVEHKVNLVDINNKTITAKHNPSKNLYKFSLSLVIQKNIAKDLLQITVDFIAPEDNLEKPVLSFVNIDGFYNHLDD